jgi:hypothetical protein
MVKVVVLRPVATFLEELLCGLMEVAWSQKSKYPQLAILLPMAAGGVEACLHRWPRIPAGIRHNLLSPQGCSIHLMLYRPWTDFPRIHTHFLISHIWKEKKLNS